MMCTMCSTEFCWVCLGVWGRKDDIYTFLHTEECEYTIESELVDGMTRTVEQENRRAARASEEEAENQAGTGQEVEESDTKNGEDEQSGEDEGDDSSDESEDEDPDDEDFEPDAMDTDSD